MRFYCRYALMGLAMLVVMATAQSAGVVYAERGAQPRAMIEVFPGPRALHKALRHANPGDVLNIHAGTYNEAVNVKKDNLTLQAAGDGTVIVDGQCNAQKTVNLDAEGITVKGLTVRGASEYDINLEHHASGMIRKNVVESTCEGAEYGINVFDGGSIQVIRNTGSGWDDAAIYIGGINATPNGPLLVKRNNVSNNVRGIIIEDSSTPVKIVVLKNNAHDNTDTGILIHNSDGVNVDRNTVTNNVANGIHLDAPSDNNVVTGNTFTGQTFDMNNEGTGNCFSDNTYVTSSGDVSHTCP